MKIYFDTSFDHSAWPGPLAEKQASFGEVWAGTAGLLGILEIRLGLVGPKLCNAERAAGLISSLQQKKGFWNESCANDPLATAHRVLAWRDKLWLQGWRGQPLSTRLKQLSNATQDVLPGYPDRLAVVCDTLEKRAPGKLSVTRLLPVNDLPKLWQDIFDLLARHGVDIRDVKLKDATASGNLAAARCNGFSPDPSDDSLQLLQPLGIQLAAENVAAWLTDLPELQGVVIINPDWVLDAALRRYGLPTTGASLKSSGNSLLQILPLVLSAGWSPPDPQWILELLMLPQSPVPRSIGWRLQKALHEWPAVGSDSWQQALSEGLDEIETEDRRKRISERLSIVFGSSAPHGKQYPAGDIYKRLDMLIKWLQAMLVHQKTDKDYWMAAIEQCMLLGRFLDLTGIAEYSEPQLQRLTEDATNEASAVSNLPAQSGLTHVDSPDAVCGPARYIVWWQFAHSTVSLIEKLPLSRNELDCLAKAGIDTSDPIQKAMATGERWCRPLKQATEKLILVCPRQGEDGETQYPHPLWDEMIARLADPGKLEMAEKLCQKELALSGKISKKKRQLISTPIPQRTWHVSKCIQPRAQESASGGGELIGCPFKWILHYQGKIRGGATTMLPEGNLLYGNLTHNIIAELFHDAPKSPEDSEQRAGELFDTKGPLLATSLFLPGADAIRASVRRVTVSAAGDLFRLMQSWGATPIASEKEFKRTLAGIEITGKPDLVIDSPYSVLDFKWGGLNYRRELLERGGAYQLAVYGFVTGDKSDILPSAFYILEGQRLMTTSKDVFQKAEIIEGPEPKAVWQAFEKGYMKRLDELKNKIIEATAIVETDAEKPPEKDGMDEEGVLALSPPCKFCDYGGLCGIVYGEPS